MPRIDSTARVAAGAQIADDVEIGPYSVIGPQVELRGGVRLASHVHVTGVTVVGEGTTIYPFASLGTPPQSVRYRGGATRLAIGRECQIREGVTINTGTEDGGGITTVGDHCFLMANSHVGHDCHVGNNVTFANNAVLGGHVTVGDRVFFGGQAAVHQFRRIGEGAMVGGFAGIGRDLIPFGFALGTPLADLVGLNVVGLKRAGLNRDGLHRLRRVYRELFLSPGILRDRVVRVEDEYGKDPMVAKILAFVRETGAKPLMVPAPRDSGAAPDDAEP